VPPHRTGTQDTPNVLRGSISVTTALTRRHVHGHHGTTEARTAIGGRRVRRRQPPLLAPRSDATAPAVTMARDFSLNSHAYHPVGGPGRSNVSEAAASMIKSKNGGGATHTASHDGLECGVVRLTVRSAVRFRILGRLRVEAADEVVPVTSPWQQAVLGRDRLHLLSCAAGAPEIQRMRLLQRT